MKAINEALEATLNTVAFIDVDKDAKKAAEKAKNKNISVLARRSCICLKEEMEANENNSCH